MLKKERMFRLFIIIGIIPLVLMTLFSYYNTSKIVDKKIDNSIKDNLVIMSRLMNSSIDNFINITNFIAADEDVQSVLMKDGYSSYDEKFDDIQKIYKITTLILANQKLDVPIYITGENSLSYYTNMDYFSEIYMDLNSDIYKQSAKCEEMGKPYIYIHRRVDGKYSKDVVMGIVKQIKDIKSDRVLGYISLDVYDDYFNDIFKTVTAYKGDNIYVLDKSGNIITDEFYKDKTGFPFYKKYANNIINNKSGSFKCNINGKNYIAYFNTIDDTGFKIVETIPVSVVYSDRKNVVLFSSIILIVFIVLAVWMSYFMYKYASKPINKLTQLMSRVESGDRTVEFDLKSIEEIGRLGTSFNSMVKEIHRIIDEVYIKKYLLKDAEFKSLKAQINPHFLYNTLESINWMAKMGKSSEVSRMVTILGKFLRYSISKKGDIVSIGEAVNQINNYISLEKMRYGDKFEIEVNVDEEIYDNKILKLIIQPIVENAIIHGLEPKIDKGRLIINGFKKDENICIEVMDDGVGMNNNIISSGEGLGIQNVDKRIKIQYGDNYGLSYTSENGFTCAQILIPCVSSIEGENNNL